MTILERAQAPTPEFFRVLRTIGLALLAAGAAVVAGPVAVPAAVATVAGYLTVAGGVLAAVSQVTVDDPTDCPPAGDDLPEADTPDDDDPEDDVD